ncbi:MAG: hypothetical protein RLZZ301_761 [Bacteroidota bacterium]|jgi:antitoxin component YwqK of YwqJK toxin-antitoxin module
MSFNRLLFLLLLISCQTFAQEVRVLKENLSPKVRVFWDAQNKHIQGTGAYFTSMATPKTTEKHGKWLFYTYDGILEEEAFYYRDRLHGKRLLYYANKQVKIESYFKFNVPDSSYREYAENGKLLVKGQFELGSPVGKWEYFFADGSPKSVEVVQQDSTYLMEYWEADAAHKHTITNGNGTIKTYYIDGVVKELYTFQNGLKTGPFEERTANGVLSISGHFQLGKKDGIWEFYQYDGLLEKRIGYQLDSLHGPYLVMLSEHDTLTSGTYANGLKEGYWKWNTEEGQLDMCGYFQHGKQDSIWHYYFPNGQLSYEAQFKADLRTGHWTYFYPNGALYRQGDYQSDQRNGLWETFYEDSILLMKGVYQNGLEEGQWLNYWENGQLKNKSSFTKGALDGPWVSYTPDGVLSVKGTYKNGLKVGEWLTYYNNGRLKEKQHYKVFTQENVSNGIAIMGLKETVSDLHGSYEAYSQIDYQLKSVGKYYHGLKHGTWTDYYPGGVVPTIVSQYRYGRLDGAFKQYDRYGRLVYEIHYKRGLKDGLFVVYGENGQIISKKQFRNGQEIGGNGQETFSPY